jgi:hypothetical protein
MKPNDRTVTVVWGPKNEENHTNGSAKKNDIFKKLLTSRTPSAANIFTLDENRGSNGSQEEMHFSAFKGIVLEENLDCSNLGANRGEENKGLKFKGFPHKKCNGNNLPHNNPTPNPTKLRTQTSALFSGGPLICEKSGSNRSQENIKAGEDMLQRVQLGNGGHPRQLVGQPVQHRIQKNNTMPVITIHPYNAYNYQYQTEPFNDGDEVIRSREGSMAFDMSPFLY